MRGNCFTIGALMDPFSLLSVGLALAFVIYIIIIANRNPHFTSGGGIQGMLWALLAINFALGTLALMNAIVDATGGLPNTMDAPAIPISSGMISFLLALGVTVIGALSIRSPRFRTQLGSTLGSHAAYDPDSALHTTALILILLLISSNLISFLLLGGIQGMADSIAEGGIAFGEVLFQQVLWIIAAFLGVGLFTRRSSPAVFERLGLRIPTLRETGAGVLVAAAAYLIAIAVGALWFSASSPEQFSEQTAASQQISAAIGSLPLALGIAGIVAVGEEIFFRGALQPVFGNLLTSIFFAVIHTQYSLTPATAIIFLVSLLMGWLRQRYNTSSAIIAHFLYNFIQLALAVAASSLVNGAAQ